MISNLGSGGSENAAKNKNGNEDMNELKRELVFLKDQNLNRKFPTAIFQYQWWTRPHEQRSIDFFTFYQFSERDPHSRLFTLEIIIRNT